jgi:alpha-glucosidase (family GH31 glycosyl hydrolase)
MSHPSRRETLKALGAGAAALALPKFTLGATSAEPLMIAGQAAELQVSSVSPVTVRLTLRAAGQPAAIPFTGALVQDEFTVLRTGLREMGPGTRVRAGEVVVVLTGSPPTIRVENAKGESFQTLVFDAAKPGMEFTLPKGPLLGLGEGGAQFDRKGVVDQMRNGQGGYRLATHGTRAPVQWLISTDGGAMFVHQPYGAFDLTGAKGKFTPTVLPPNPANQMVNSTTPVAANEGLPLDIFVVASKDPVVIMREYARITGLPELPARWTLGYQQSHRTLDGPDSVLEVARLLREKKLPCDALIYLGTEFTPSGWNTRNGEFTWHTGNFPDPKGMIDKLHADRFKVILHIVIEGRRLVGSVGDACTAAPQPTGRDANNQWPGERQVSCYWPAHKHLMDIGVDAWWPDQGDGYDGPSRFNRHRMYWEGTQIYKPNERPYALHRNASAGIQRYAGYIWSGDVQSRWDTLRAHVPVALNTGLSGLPLWGTDIGGFYGTSDYTGELFVRWFQFAAFCPLFRSHGRNWHLHTPWGWDGGDGGPNETANFVPDPNELRNKLVEPICRQYLELRMRMMPYIYTALKDTTETGLPMMRAMWLHHPDDPDAVKRGDQFYWGRDLLVAPVIEKGATTRKLYLPKGTWIDWWSELAIDGGREIECLVDLSTTPLYARAGAVIPTGPVKQYTDEQVPGNTRLTVYPGADGTSSMYEDDGKSFNYRSGEWMRVLMQWRDATRELTLRLAPDSKVLGSGSRTFEVRVAGSDAVKLVEFTGRPVAVRL